MKGAATAKLEAFGVDALCEGIGEGHSLTFLARDIGVSIGLLLAWIEADPERSARVRETRATMGKVWDEKAEDAIKQADDEFKLKKAKELAHHYRWRAKAIAPREYGDRMQLEHDVTGNLAEDLKAARERAGKG